MEEKFEMITAKEARSLVEGDSDKILKELDKLIRAAVLKGAECIRVPYDMTRSSGYKIEFKNPSVSTELEKLGFKVTSRSEDRQFVDVWLEVSW